MLYTFVLDWGGGTFLSQCESGCINEAVKSWLNKFDVTLLGDGVEATDKFLMSFDGECPTPVNGLASVWCISSIFKDSLAVIHIIETSRLERIVSSY